MEKRDTGQIIRCRAPSLANVGFTEKSCYGFRDKDKDSDDNYEQNFFKCAKSYAFIQCMA